MAQIPLGTQFIGLASTYQTVERRSALINNESQPYTMQDIIDTVGGGLEGTQYVFVAADGTDVENAAELQAAYVTAQGMSPSASNRITIIAAPGKYNFGSTQFTMNTQYIDLVSLDGNRSIVFNSSSSNGTILITANDVFVKGVDVLNKAFRIANSLYLLKVENCKGGSYSFGNSSGTGVASGTFTNCTGGELSFGFVANGTFNNCTGGEYSFGAFGTANGTFNNCTGGQSSFGGGGGTASGTFNNCTGLQSSFGGGGGTAQGTFNNCTGGESSFGGFGTAQGTFNNCKGGEYSFGALGILMGSLYYCRLTIGSFETVTSPGVTRLCIDGNNVINNQG